MQSRTGVNIAPETCYELSKIENIVAVKEASGNISQVAKIRHLCGDDLDIYSGNDDQAVAMMSLGGIGVISVLSNFLPGVMHKMCAEYLEGHTKAAAEMQIKYVGLMNALFSDVNPIPVKEAMNMLGLEAGPCRLPLYPMDEGARAVLREKLIECGCLK